MGASNIANYVKFEYIKKSTANFGCANINLIDSGGNLINITHSNVVEHNINHRNDSTNFDDLFRSTTGLPPFMASSQPNYTTLGYIIIKSDIKPKRVIIKSWTNITALADVKVYISSNNNDYMFVDEFKPTSNLQTKEIELAFTTSNFLIIANDDYIYTHNNSWVNIGQLPPDQIQQKLLFEEYGMEIITGEQIDELKAMLPNKKIKVLSANIY